VLRPCSGLLNALSNFSREQLPLPALGLTACLLLPCSMLLCASPLQRTADFLRANKLGHCLLWSSHAGTAAGGDGPLPKQAAVYTHASPAHRVRQHSAAQHWAALGCSTLIVPPEPA
jgi:hypothetical protein